MKRMSVALGAALVLSLAMSGGAQARCSATCLNHKVRQLSSGLIKAEKTIAALSKTVAQQGQQISVLNQTVAAQGATVNGLAGAAKFATLLEKCLYEAPFTEYGDPEGTFGYHYNTGTEEIETSALDITEEGGPIDAWFIFDACNPQTTLSINGTGGVFPRAASSSPLFSSAGGSR